jgi:hypothetical protein
MSWRGRVPEIALFTTTTRPDVSAGHALATRDAVARIGQVIAPIGLLTRPRIARFGVFLAQNESDTAVVIARPRAPGGVADVIPRTCGGRS